MQTRLQSFIESCVNILIGYSIAILSQIIIFPFFDIYIPITDNLWIGMWFTIVSLVRSYCIRRWYARKLKKSYEASWTKEYKDSSDVLKDMTKSIEVSGTSLRLVPKPLEQEK